MEDLIDYVYFFNNKLNFIVYIRNNFKEIGNKELWTLIVFYYVI